MKVLHIGQLIGGLDIYIRNSIAFASGDIEYIIMHGKDDNNKPIFSNGKAVKEYKTSLQRNLSVKADIKALWEAIRIIKKEKPDAIHCHSAKGGIIGRVAGFLTHIPTLYTPHGYSFLCTPSKVKRWMFKTIERITRCGSYMLACGESEQQLGITEVGYNKDKALCWHNCVASKECEHFDDSNYIVTIGRPSYQKNPFFLVDVIQGVHERHPEVKFYLLGVGFYSPDLEEMNRRIKGYSLQDTIVLKDWLDHEQTMEFVKSSLLYLTVSRYEGLPLAVLEAMSLGKCIVASKVVGNVDCVHDGYNGKIIDLDVQHFVETICDILDHPNRIDEYGNNSWQLYKDEFDIRKRIGMLEETYHKIVKK